MKMNKYFSNDNLKPNQLEPINILFDIINELIFYIQREIKNNDILMKELKISKNKRTEQENLINKLNMMIKEKDSTSLKSPSLGGLYNLGYLWSDKFDKSVSP